MRGIKKISRAVLVCLVLMFVLTGCSLKPIGEKEARERIQNYLMEKYGESFELSEIHWVRKMYEKNVKSQGYYAKTTDGFYVRLNVFDKKFTNCVDTREYPAIEAALEEYFTDNPISDSYKVCLTPVPEGAAAKDVWDALSYAFSGKFNGDPIGYLNGSKKYPAFEFAMDGPPSATPVLLMARAENRWDYPGDQLQEYVNRFMDEHGAGVNLRVDVVNPIVQEQELALLLSHNHLEKDEWYSSSNVVLTSVKAGESSYIQPAVHQAASVEGFEISVVNSCENIRSFSDQEIGLIIQDGDGETVDQPGYGKFRVVGSIYTLTGDIKREDMETILELDASVLAPGEPEEGLLLISSDESGYSYNTVECYSLKDEVWEVKYGAYQNGSRYVLTAGAYDKNKRQFFFARAYED